jgi:catechol 2,3-dioxygenase-like lactoylglutathione lyase family enzyme
VMELYQLPKADLEDIKNRKSGNIDHVAFDVNDIDETFEYLKNKGFEIEENAPVFLNFWTKGCLYFNVIGPDGERLEFNQIL